MELEPCPYCGKGVVSFDVRENGVGLAWLAATCEGCGFALYAPLNAPKIATRERQWKQASDIWKRMGTLFRSYREPAEGEWTKKTDRQRQRSRNEA